MMMAVDETMFAEGMQRLATHAANSLGAVLDTSVVMAVGDVTLADEPSFPTWMTVNIEVAVKLEGDRTRSFTYHRSMPRMVVEAFAGAATVPVLASKLWRTNTFAVDVVNQILGELTERAAAVITSASTGPGVHLRGVLAERRCTLVEVGALTVDQLITVLEGRA